MFYIIYKTTNLINGKFYIGKHKTKDLNDGYLGSGKLLKRAINKYGIDNFHREILHICKDENHMNLLESILVVPDDETNYNLCEGGKGGWSFVNRNKLWNTDKHLDVANLNRIKATEKLQHLAKTDICWKQKHSSKMKIVNNKWIKEKYPEGIWKGKKHIQETKRKIGQSNSIKQSGQLNSQYGTCWITNGIENRKIKKEELDSWIELGYNKGRLT